MPNHASLASLFGDIADAIRGKTGGSTPIVADDFPTAIAAIPAGGTVDTKTAKPTNSANISFTGLSGRPKMFYVSLNATISTSQRIIGIFSDGTNIAGYHTVSGGATYSGNYTFSYNNGTLAISHTVYAQFVTGSNYTLVYVY